MLVSTYVRSITCQDPMSAVQNRRYQERASTGARLKRVAERMHHGSANGTFHWLRVEWSPSFVQISNGWNKYTHHRSCWPRHDFFKITITEIGLELEEMSILCFRNQDLRIHVLE